ncbi:MAG: hypothetical protein FWH37_03505 [Candidatus Bathyarchaeota archaeon]|nr:hypothetical protein [Candidatus Termiticorpusculum sp.]
MTVEAVFTVEEKIKLQKLTEEVPKLRLRVEELEETLEILSNKELMQSIEVSEKDMAENRLFSRSEALKELGLMKKTFEFLVMVQTSLFPNSNTSIIKPNKTTYNAKN